MGSRGEVQPVAALALRLMELGQEVRVCAPPDFRSWLEERGIPAVGLGPEMHPSAAPGWDLSTPEGRRWAADDTVAAQFATLPDVARGCDVLVACGAMQVAARSVAEALGIEYAHVHYCPVTLPSVRHAPAVWPGWPPDKGGNTERWEAESQRWADTWGPALNAHRRGLGMGPVADVRAHVLGDRPWLAADPVLGPWPDPDDTSVFQTGAWLLPDERPLPDELEEFLDAGEPPVYCGLGSMAAPGQDTGAAMLAAARELGRRVLLSRGWADLHASENAGDCLVIGDVNHSALFGRIAAAVHHGGAGTATTAARAGVPQVVVPQVYDQPYWANRVERLGIGIAHPPGAPTATSLTTALNHALTPETRGQARTLAEQITTDGTLIAAQELVA